MPRSARRPAAEWLADSDSWEPCNFLPGRTFLGLMSTLSARTCRTTLVPGRSKAARAGMAGLLVSVLSAAPLSFRAPAPEMFGAGRGEAAPPRVQEILRKAIERARRDDEQNIAGKYTYTQRSTVEELDFREGVKKREERLLYVFPIEGEPYSRLIEKDGRPLSEKDAKLERERERKFRQRLADRRRRKERGEKADDDINIDEQLVSKYRFALTGREPVNGRPAYVLSFEPRSSDLPVKRRLDRLLNKVAGRIWVDQQDYEISRADLHLAENLSAWGGMLASVRKFLLRVEQVKVDETAWLPSYVDAYFDGRMLIKSFHMKLKQQNSEFRKVASESALAGSPKQ